MTKVRVLERSFYYPSPLLFGVMMIVLLLGTIANSSLAQTSGKMLSQAPSESGSADPGNILPSYTQYALVPRDLAPPAGLIVEMSLAPPENIPTGYYDLAKYGRVGVDYTRAAVIDGANLGLAAQALHVEHHLLLYSAGLSSDINNDGMFLLTAGIAHYQTGNDQAAFVDAPFVRFRFQSSEDYVFVYSEIETTMHFSQYISGMAGLGLRVSPSLRLMGGFHHTEFVMPAEQTVQMVNGLEGIISWGL